jgi:hypothetical protein
MSLPGEPGDSRKPLANLAVKSAAAEAGFSMPDLTHLLTDASSSSNEQDADLPEIQNITGLVDAEGKVSWTPPSVKDTSWEILRIGYTSSDARVSTSSGAWQGLAIDYLDPAALDLYWNKNVLPLIEASQPYVGKTLKYIATDSWELGGANWTGSFREEFRRRRGYDPVPYLPIVAGRIVGNRDLSTRFLADLRRTVADLVSLHYDHLAELSAHFGLGLQSESGGPHSAPLDALQTFRSSAIPQTEYWAMSPTHRSADADRFFVKEAASAAHIYGRKLVAAEGMTSIGNHWDESLGMNLKPSFDQALTEGLNRLVWHEFTSSPPELGLPGQEYFAGTHLNPNVTWWRDAGQFLLYLNRAQYLLQQGQPVADVLYYYGDNVPNFVRLKQDDPAQVLPGFDYDVTNTDALLSRISFTGGMLHTPEGVQYRALALPRSQILPLSVLKLAQAYVLAGGTLIGDRPLRSQGIVPAADASEFAAITDTMWSRCEQNPDHYAAIGKGHLYCTHSSRAALRSIGHLPDLEVSADSSASLDYVHRRTNDTDIYFIRNTQPQPLQATITLRVDGKQPEILDADSGDVNRTLLFSPTDDHRTRLSVSFGPRGSAFVVFRHPAAKNRVTRIIHNGTVLYSATDVDHTALPPDLTVQLDNGSAQLSAADAGVYQITFAGGHVRRTNVAHVPGIDLPGPWTLSFPANWGAPSQLQLNHLLSWTDSSDPGVRYFSGTATYKTTVHLTAAQLSAAGSMQLDLGEVHEVAAVRINGKPATILWKAPYSLRADSMLHTGENTIEIDVTNLWPNRLIGDAQPTGKRYTWTNIRKYKKDSPLLPSGLLGPVGLHPLYRLALK